jgi:hypothetical protein
VSYIILRFKSINLFYLSNKLLNTILSRKIRSCIIPRSCGCIQKYSRHFFSLTDFINFRCLSLYSQISLNFTKQCPWKTDFHSSSHEAPRILRNQKVHYRVTVLTNKQRLVIYPETEESIFLRSILILSSPLCLSLRVKSPKLSRLSIQNSVCISHLCHAYNMPFPSQSSRSDPPANIAGGLHITYIFTVQFSPPCF